MVAPTPIIVAKECVSKHSPDCMLIDTYPLNPSLIKLVFTAPTHKSIGIGHLFSDIFLSDNTSWVIPSLAAISESCTNFSIASSKF